MRHRFWLRATTVRRFATISKSLPNPAPPAYDEVQRLALAANPLGCEDHPHSPGIIRPGYLWQRDGKPQILDDYDKHRAFYGCLDWHSAVNSTWMMISLIKADPTIAVAPAIRNELASHFQKENIDGELAFFTKLQGLGADFEKPYGYAWLLKLYGELKTWNDPDGQRAATILEPLAKWISAQYVLYLHSLNYPVRVGLHPNTALDMGFVLDYTNLVKDQALETAINETAMRLFGNDVHCATASEPVFGDFAAPCLTEAALMGRVMTPENYAKVVRHIPSARLLGRVSGLRQRDRCCSWKQPRYNRNRRRGTAQRTSYWVEFPARCGPADDCL